MRLGHLPERERLKWSWTSGSGVFRYDTDEAERFTSIVRDGGAKSMRSFADKFLRLAYPFRITLGLAIDVLGSSGDDSVRFLTDKSNG